MVVHKVDGIECKGEVVEGDAIFKGASFFKTALKPPYLIKRQYYRHI
jgi:hypothetical protein